MSLLKAEKNRHYHANLFNCTMILTSIVSFLLFFAFSYHQVYASEVKQDKYFQVDAGNEWVEIPSEAIALYSDQVYKKTGQTITYLTGYANTKASGNNWFSVPFILVTSSEKGRYPQEKLDELVEKAGGKMIENLKDIKDFVPPIRPGSMSYEKKRQIIWVEMISEIPQLGDVHAITAMLLTNKGSLNFILYALPADREARLRSLNILLDRVKLDQDMVYQAGIERKSTENRIAEAASRGLFKALFMVLIITVLFAGYKFVSNALKRPKGNLKK